MQQLFTPWRYLYISSSAPTVDCFLCAAAGAPDGADSLVVHRAQRHLVMLNLHPYSTGHLMVAPLAHYAAPHEGPAEDAAEIWPLILRCQRVLGSAYSPHGFNLGANLGAPAGAGVPGHFHVHVLPRWTGDTNFMTVLGEVRLIPEDLRQTRDRLRDLFAREEA